MEKFEAVVAKHGEHGVQAILENWERYMGMRCSAPMSLEDRWTMFIEMTTSPMRAAA